MSSVNIKQLNHLIKEQNSNEVRTIKVNEALQKMYNPVVENVSPQKWEYATYYFPRHDYGPSEEEGDQLNRAGLEGWELIHFIQYPINDGYTQSAMEYIFKRKLI